MNPPGDEVKTDKSNGPEDNENDGDGPKHKRLLLMTRAAERGTRTIQFSAAETAVFAMVRG